MMPKRCWVYHFVVDNWVLWLLILAAALTTKRFWAVLGGILGVVITGIVLVNS